VAKACLCFLAVAAYEDLWIPLADEPIGTFVTEAQQELPEIEELVASPQRLLAFRTFAYIRVGILLGRLLVERDLSGDRSGAWAEELLAERDVREQAIREIRGVAEEIAADAAYADEQPAGPDEAARARFREFAKKQLASDL
jgi:hypothetical protein